MAMQEINGKYSFYGRQRLGTALAHLGKGVLEADDQRLLAQPVIAALDRRDHLVKLGVKAPPHQKRSNVFAADIDQHIAFRVEDDAAFPVKNHHQTKKVVFDGAMGVEAEGRAIPAARMALGP